MFLILLIYHLIDDFFDFPEAYSRKYTVLIKVFFINGNVLFCILNTRALYNNYIKVLFSCSLKPKLDQHTHLLDNI